MKTSYLWHDELLSYRTARIHILFWCHAACDGWSWMLTVLRDAANTKAVFILVITATAITASS